jgi:hypothetical protein
VLRSVEREEFSRQSSVKEAGKELFDPADSFEGRIPYFSLFPEKNFWNGD